MERDETVLEKEKVLEVTKENLELAASVKNGDRNGKHIERYPLDDFVIISIKLILSKDILN